MLKRFIFSLVFLQLVFCIKAQDNFKYTNELVHEKSEYLLQHAHNPVDWMPWGNKAFEKAQKENKLILISIGYSACHWCHVMEKESFEDETIANYMNEHFVCIKVDREERMDIDKMYMLAASLITKNTGWPLNCIALSDGRPFFGGTYYAPEDWLKILKTIVEMQSNNPEKIVQYADDIESGIVSSQFIPIDTSVIVFNKMDIQKSVSDFRQFLDFEKGGLFSKQNKFPMSSNLDFIMNYAFDEKDTTLMNYVFTSLDKMSFGGIYDQVGGGFARYSTDVNWKVPHFEKMLYTNAQLISNYSDAYKISKDENYKRIVVQTIDWLEREMTGAEGSFFASQDADSEGGEGLYYTWTKDELKSVLEEDFEWVKNYFEINALGAFEGDRYILVRSMSDDQFTELNGLSIDELYEKLNRNIAKLKKARDLRIKPKTDRKVITSWNAMMISGLVDAYEAFGEKHYLNLAQQSMSNILNSLDENGKLLHLLREESKVIGYLDDYAFTIKALIDLYQVTFEEKYLNKAQKLGEDAIKFFKNPDNPYFIYSIEEDNRLSIKSIELEDNVIPSSNAVMADNLFLLGLLFENEDFLNTSKEMCLNMKSTFIENGISYSYWGKVMQYFSNSFYEVVITGNNYESIHLNWMKQFVPNTITLGGKSPLPLLKEKMDVDVPTIFVCKEKVCQNPVYTINEALKLMPH